MKRVFLIVLDSFGIGEMPDADAFGDAGSNTIKACSTSDKFKGKELKTYVDGVGVTKTMNINGKVIPLIEEKNISNNMKIDIEYGGF